MTDEGLDRAGSSDAQGAQGVEGAVAEDSLPDETTEARGDQAARSAMVTELNDLAGAWGAPGAVQDAVRHLPGAITVDVAHDFSVTLGLLLGDLAEVLAADSAVESSSTTRDGHCGRTETVSLASDGGGGRP